MTPAGRKQYLLKLVKHLEQQKESFAEWHLWNNTRDDKDESFLYELQKQYDWIKVINRELGSLKGQNSGISKFFDYTTDPNKIYIRLDDDIIWLQDDFVKNMVNFRVQHPKYLFVTANVVNNNVIAHISLSELSLSSLRRQLHNSNKEIETYSKIITLTKLLKTNVTINT